MWHIAWLWMLNIILQQKECSQIAQKLMDFNPFPSKENGEFF